MDLVRACVPLVALLHIAHAIVTPYHPARECVADAAYIVPNFKANWFKAVEYCHYLGRTLVTLETEQRQRTIDQLLDATDGTCYAHPRDQSYWSGANDLADGGLFHWHLTGRPVSLGWSNWRVPPTAGAEDDPDALKVRCVAMAADASVADDVEELQMSSAPLTLPPSTWSWTVADCWRELYFICERTGEPPACR
uniref:C-type lectin domain-containing protein n=1 Tax=Anopheles dirus TaxID=7168 RepID=A0A182MZJ2_9DIPT